MLVVFRYNEQLSAQKTRKPVNQNTETGNHPPDPEAYILSDYVNNYGGILLDYGYIEVSDDLALQMRAAGSFEVEFAGEPLVPTGIVLYPKIQAVADKQKIAADGVDTATITATTPDDDEIVFVLDGVEYRRQATDGVASLVVTCDDPGMLLVEVRSPTKYGRNYIPLEVVPIA